MRVHILAKDLKVPSKVIIEKCKAEGLKVTNHMSTLSAGLEATVREWFSDGRHDTTVETTTRVDLDKAREQAKKREEREKARVSTLVEEHPVSAATADLNVVAEAGGAALVGGDSTGAAVVTGTAVVEVPADVPGVSVDAPTSVETSSEQAVSGQPVSVEAGGGVEADDGISAGSAAADIPDADIPDAGIPDAGNAVAGIAATGIAATGAEAVADSTAAPEAAGTAAPESQDAGSVLSGQAEGQAVAGNESGGEGAGSVGEVVVKESKPVVPAGPQNVPKPVQLKGPRVVRYEPIEQSYSPPPRRRPAPASPSSSSSTTSSPGGSPPADAGRRRGRGARGPVQYPPAAASKGRPVRPGGEKRSAEQLREWKDRDLAERQERISDATGRRIHSRRAVGGRKHAPTFTKKTEATIQAPIRMKELCAATGVSMLHMLPLLRREYNFSANINSELTTEMAEFVTMEHGITLTIKPAKTEFDVIQEEFEALKPRDVRLRPPVVTFLGHVDHGKTSLLDAIRATNVTKSEDGGITQHIGAYHLNHKTAGKVTFLDTPGHEAFTAMRSRGAGLTDIAVLVVAADDGVMPQTVEAINHVKAAGVPIVVALNKIDLGDQNIQQIFGQLAERELQPSEWGGETDVIRVSATTGEGIDDIVEHLSALGEVLELKAPHKGPGFGTVIEAETKEGVGSVARVLVQGGVLKTGSIVVCGHAYGKVRALIDDRGNRLKEATPSIPVEIWGLDEVPIAGDKLFEVKSMQRAKTAAEELRHQRVSDGRATSRKMRSLEDVFKLRDQGEVPVLNLIIRADVDGSVDALRSMLEKLPTDEVRMSIRHAAVGAVTDGDVLLADASDAIIVAFRVAPSVRVKRLAEDKGVDIRQYKVIYEVQDEIRKALEGLLSPDITEETRATVEVREVFKLSKIGTVAGSLVTDGAIKRNHVVRLIRNGVVIRSGCKIASLKRFKDDAKEVRAGMECGIRIDGFDDVKSGDVVEAYEVISTARTL